jgi:hypothetical protein
MRLGRNGGGELGDMVRRLDGAREDLERAEQEVAAAARERGEKLSGFAQDDLDADQWSAARGQVVEAERLALDRRDGARERVEALEALCAKLAVAEARSRVEHERAFLGPLEAEEATLRARLAEIEQEKARIEARVADLEDEALRAAAPYDAEAARRQRTLDAQRRERIEWVARRPRSMWPGLLADEPPAVRRAVEEVRSAFDGERERRGHEISTAAARSRADSGLIDAGDDPYAVRPGQRFPSMRG